ncbi:MAG: DedA family protein [Undibacterium sp.]
MMFTDFIQTDFFQNILSFLLVYKYLGLFLITFLAAFALPLPSSSSLMTAAGFASQGYLSIGWVIFFATLGNTLADNISYWVIRRYGYSVFRRIGFRKIVESPVFAALPGRIARHAPSIIFFSRFEVLATIAVNVLMGFAKTDYRKFFIFVLAGETAQVTLFASIGYFFGNNWEAIMTTFGEFTLILSLIAISILVFFRKRLIGAILGEPV